MTSMKNYKSFSKADRSKKFRILFHHFVKRFLLILSTVSSDLMNEIASSPEFAVIVLMVIATHLGLEYRLVLGQFLKAMSEKTVESIHTETGFCETFVELDLAFVLIGRVLPTDLTAIHHNLFIITFLSRSVVDENRIELIMTEWAEYPILVDQNDVLNQNCRFFGKIMKLTFGKVK